MGKYTIRVKKIGTKKKKTFNAKRQKSKVGKKSKRNTHKRKHLKRRKSRHQRGGVNGASEESSGWKGGPVTVPKSKDEDERLAQTLYRNNGYDPLPDDFKVIDLYDLPKTKDMLNDYFSRKIITHSKKKVGLTIEDLKLSECKQILRSGTGIRNAICLNIEYTRKFGMRTITGYSQIGPVQFFEDDGSIYITLIMILNLLDLRFDASDLEQEFYKGEDTYKHRASLIIKRLTQAEFDDYQPVVMPPRVTVSAPPVSRPVPPSETVETRRVEEAKSPPPSRFTVTTHTPTD